MAVICKYTIPKMGESCCRKEDCPHYRWDEDVNSMCCWMSADEKAKYRTRLTDEEWNAITKLTNETKLDSSFDLCQTANDSDPDYWWDFDNNCQMNLRDGLQELWEGLAYPPQHDGLSKEEAKLVADVLLEFRIVSKKHHEWLMQDGEEVNA